MELQSLSVKKREGKGKGPSRRTRVLGEVPGILYGLGKDPVQLTLNGKAFDHILHGKMGEHAMLKLDVENNPELGGPALLKDVQHHPVRGTVVHADFLRFNMDEKIQTLVPISLVGRCKGVIEGGVADQMLHELEIECFPMEVPDKIEYDITELAIGDTVSVADLVAPNNVTILADGERPVVSVLAPRVAKSAEEEEAEAAEAADAAEAEAAKSEESEK